VAVGPRDWRRADEEILADVCERMAEHSRLEAHGIDIAVANGEVSRQGVVVRRAA
jgi:osmotically-inducible protein OsmY